MKKTLFLILSAILVSSCANKQEPKIVYKYIEKPVYIECEKPTIPEKPEFKPYQIFRVQFEGDYYYCVNVVNAKILSENWLRYKNWCESLEINLKRKTH